MTTGGPAFQTQFQPAFGGGKMWTPFLILLLVAHIVGYLLGILVPGLANGLLAFTTGPLPVNPLVWQYVTYTLVHPMPFSLIGALFLFFFLGGRLEREWGVARYGLFYLLMAAATVAVRALGVPAGTSLTGVSGLFYAHIAAFAMIFRHQRLWMMFGTIGVQALMIILVVLTVLINIRTPTELLWLVGIPFGIAFVKFKDFRRKGVGQSPTPPPKRFSSLDIED